MKTRADFLKPVEDAVRSHGGSASLVEVARYIWENHESDLRKSGNLFYRWQYEVRWAATRLRRTGVLKPATASPKGVWELA
jgi:hypothetical protein